MRGSIISLYTFRIKTRGYGIEHLKEELNKKRITQEEFNYLREYYEKNLKGIVY